MAALVCEICGGKLMAKSGGVFECEYCGMQYDKTRVQEMIQEIKGTVKVEGTVEIKGTVAVDTKVTKDNLLKRIAICAGDGDKKKVLELVEEVLSLDPECGEAYLWKLRATKGALDLDKLFDKPIYDLEKIAKDPSWTNALKYSDPETRQMLERRHAEAVERWQERQRQLKEHWQKEKQIMRLRHDAIAPVQELMFDVSGGLVCLKADGTVLVTHTKKASWLDALTTWTGVKKIITGSDFVMGLRWDGTILHAGEKTFSGICQLTEVKDIAEYGDVVVALTHGGELFSTHHGVIVEKVLYDYYVSYYCCRASGWTDVEHIRIAQFTRESVYRYIHGHQTKNLPCYVVLGLTGDGRVRCANSPEAELTQYIQPANFKAQRDVVKINHNGNLLLKDGTIWYIKDNSLGSKKWLDFDIDEMGNCSGDDFSHGAVACHYTGEYELCSNGILRRKYSDTNPAVDQWTNIAAFNYFPRYNLQLGLGDDGKILAAWQKGPQEGLCLDGWRLFESLDTFEAERRAAENKCIEAAEVAKAAVLAAKREQQEKQRIAFERRNAGLCQHCGGSFKGLFIKKCVNCGKEKDYI